MNSDTHYLAIASRADEGTSVEEKHLRFFRAIKDLPEPWGTGNRSVPPIPQFGLHSTAIAQITGFFQDHVRSADLIYPYRRNLSDNSLSDDRLYIELNPCATDVDLLVYRVIPQYIEAFDAYRVECGHENFVYEDYESLQGARYDSRHHVHRVDPISYFDELLCERAFQLRPADVISKLEGQVEHAQLLRGGAYIVGSSKCASFPDECEVSRRMTGLLLPRSGATLSS